MSAGVMTKEQRIMQRGMSVWLERFEGSGARSTLLTLRILTAMPYTGVKKLARGLGARYHTVADHLMCLESAGLVRSRRAGGIGQTRAYELTEAGARLFEPLGKVKGE